MDRAMINEMADATLKRGELNGRLWRLVMRLGGALGMRLENLPGQARAIHGQAGDDTSQYSDSDQNDTKD